MHTMWKGSISFGLVNIPIKMFAATENKDIRFRYLHKKCNTPLKYKKMCPTCNKEVSEDEIVKGYEYEQGHFVIINDEDFAILKSGVKKSIEILDFVQLNEIDPIYFDKTYYLAPQDIGAGSKAYNLLLTAMNDTNKIAVAKVILRDKESLAVIRVYKNALVMETIFYPNEIRDIKLVPGLPENQELDQKELKIATQLIENLTAKFEPSKYTNNYREQLKDLIEQKISGKEIQIAPEVPDKNVINLMEALQASLKETKKSKSPTTRRKTKTTKKATKKTTAS